MIKLFKIFSLLLIFGVASCSSCEPEPLPNVITAPSGAKARWSSSDFPLMVKIPIDLPDEMKEAVLYATDRWNRAADCQCFRIMMLPPGSPEFNGGILFKTVTLQVGDIQMNRGGDTDLTFVDGELGEQGKLFSAEVTISPLVARVHIHNVVTHELGHIFGLDHDAPGTDSVMVLEYQKNKGVITDEDSQYVHAQYGFGIP